MLGETNGTMVYTMVTDIIANSLGKDAIIYSPDLSTAIRDLKAFNLTNIYKNPAAKKHLNHIKDLFEILFTRYLTDLEQGRETSPIVTSFLANLDDDYRSTMPPAVIVRDFIAGMTDRYFLDQCPESLRPDTLVF